MTGTPDGNDNFSADKLEKLYGYDVEREHANFVWQRFRADPTAQAQAIDVERRSVLIYGNWYKATPHGMFIVTLRLLRKVLGLSEQWLDIMAATYRPVEEEQPNGNSQRPEKSS